MSRTQEFFRKLRPSPFTLALIGLIVYFWFRPPAWVEKRAEPAPAMAELQALRGKVVLVNFWATWCPHCRHEMPAKQAFYKDYQAQGFEILAWSVDETQAEVDAFMRAKGYDFPARLAPPGAQSAFGVTRLPTSFIVDRDGVVRHRIAGQVHYPRLESLVGPLLAP